MLKVMETWRLCLCIMALLACTVQVQAADGDLTAPSHGLMWHRSGLPAVFPLQIKTLGPQDYYVTLTSVETQKAVLAAYIDGGRFFQVLVPPGTFRVQIAAGADWKGEDALFGEGDKTWRYEVNRPLTFAVRSFNTKGGHIVDLTDVAPGEEAQVVPRDLVVCQGVRLVRTPEQIQRGPAVERSLRTGVPRFRHRPLANVRIKEALADFEIEDVSKKSVTDKEAVLGWGNSQRIEVRSRPCGPDQGR